MIIPSYLSILKINIFNLSKNFQSSHTFKKKKKEKREKKKFSKKDKLKQKDHHCEVCRKAQSIGGDRPTLLGAIGGVTSSIQLLSHWSTFRDLSGFHLPFPKYFKNHNQNRRPFPIQPSHPLLKCRLVSRRHKTLVASTTLQPHYRSHTTLPPTRSRQEHAKIFNKIKKKVISFLFYSFLGFSSNVNTSIFLIFISFYAIYSRFVVFVVVLSGDLI